MTDRTSSVDTLFRVPTQTTFAREALRGAGLTFRPATLDDVAWCARLQTAREPSEPANEEQLRQRWQLNDPERIDESWIVEEDGAPVGHAYFGHPAWAKSPVRGARLLAWFARDGRRPERLGRAFDLLEPYAIRDGTRALMAGTNNDGENKPILHLNEEMGYGRIPGHIQLLKRVGEGAAA